MRSAWSREGSLEILDVTSDGVRARTFLWPGRVLVVPEDDGLSWTPLDDHHPVPPGRVLVAPEAAGHLRLDAPVGVRYRMVFVPPHGEPLAPMRVALPRIQAARADVPLAELVARAFDTLAREAPVTIRLSPAVARARALLRDDACAITDLESLGARVGIERCHLCRSFQRATGLPPLRYRAQLRIARARALLRQGLDCIDVAHVLGFCDQSHLTRNFKEHCATTPGAYARAMRVVADRPCTAAA